MEWLEVHIDTNHAGLEPLEIFLSANGVDGVGDIAAMARREKA